MYPECRNTMNLRIYWRWYRHYLQSILNLNWLSLAKASLCAKVVIAEIRRLGLEERVVFLKDRPFTDLPSIYQLATVFVYPSFYEGFASIIEALYGKIPGCFCNRFLPGRGWWPSYPVRMTLLILRHWPRQ